MTTAPTPTFAIVPSPPAAPPIVGLFQAANDLGTMMEAPAILDADGVPARWEDGYAYLSESPTVVSGVLDPCLLSGGTENMTNIPVGSGTVSEMPFLVWAGDHCSTFGWSEHDFQGRAQRILEAVESFETAREFWLGTQSITSSWPNFSLANNPAVIDVGGGSAQTVGAALDLLEQGIAHQGKGARGVIHCTAQLGSAWSQLGNVFKNVGSNLIQTYRGTVIIPDAGYPGDGPTGQPPGTGGQWAYGTLVPTIRKSQVEIYPSTLQEATFRTTNYIEYRAVKLVGVTVDPAVLVTTKVSLPYDVNIGS